MFHLLQILKLYEEAVNSGFAAALTVDSTNVEALLGLGDAHTAAGKLLAQSGNMALAKIHWKQSSEAFMKASKFLAAGNLQPPFFNSYKTISNLVLSPQPFSDYS